MASAQLPSNIRKGARFVMLAPALPKRLRRPLHYVPTKAAGASTHPSPNNVHVDYFPLQDDDRNSLCRGTGPYPSWYEGNLRTCVATVLGLIGPGQDLEFRHGIQTHSPVGASIDIADAINRELVLGATVTVDLESAQTTDAAH